MKDTTLTHEEAANENGRATAMQVFTQQHTPLEMIDTRTGRGGQNFHYLRHQFVTEKLNEVAGHDWDFRVLRERLDGKCVTVLGELTLRAGEHTVVKSQFGSSDVKESKGEPLSIGDDFKSAASDALKKCASLLGLGIDLSIPARPETLAALNEAGQDVFGDDWPQKRSQSMRTLTGGRGELTDVEARALTCVIQRQNMHVPIVRETARKLK